MEYRLNFVMWRVRWIIQRLIVYFLWWSVFANQRALFGYTESMMLTYILLSNVVGTFTLGTTTMEIGNMINRGDLSFLLLKPINFFRYYMSRDIADKLLNVGFGILEIGLLLIMLHPPIFVQSYLLYLIAAAFAVLLGAFVYYLFSVLLGLIGFWSADVWVPRFLSFIIMEFFAGGLFPLDILPKQVFIVSQRLPFYYVIYFPIRIYLGQLSWVFIIEGFAFGFLWLAVLWILAQYVWQKGLRVYAAEGR